MTSPSHGLILTPPYKCIFSELPPLILSEAEISTLANSMIDNSVEESNSIDAGYTYFGQFMVHDLTFSVSGIGVNPIAQSPNQNLRSPLFDLDSLYGNGPFASPSMYNKIKSGFILTGQARDPLSELPVKELDLPRNHQGVAIIGDPRNDENIIISQIQLKFISLHNQIMQLFLDRGRNNAEAFELSKKNIKDHYHWLILNDYLPKLIGSKTLKALISSPTKPLKDSYKGKYYKPHSNFLPTEFAMAAFRVGHAMVRGTYTLNSLLSATEPDLPVFSPTGDNDLRGGRYLPSGWSIDWRWFFNQDDTIVAQRSRKIAPSIVSALTCLPGMTPSNLAERTLNKGCECGLASGQKIAQTMQITPVRKTKTDPLWFYILHEAAEMTDGQYLGPVGGTILGETLLSCLANDAQSILNLEPGWRPRITSLAQLFNSNTPIEYFLKDSGEPLGTFNNIPINKTKNTVIDFTSPTHPQ